ncbi:hypothetical protein MJO28_005196, partial [Puccinia striiformis f. sp. tritici]
RWNRWITVMTRSDTLRLNIFDSLYLEIRYSHVLEARWVTLTGLECWPAPVSGVGVYGRTVGAGDSDAHTCPLIAALEKSIESELVAKALKPALECDKGSSSASLDTDARDDREEDEEMALLDLEVKAKALLVIQAERYLGPRMRLEQPPDAHEFVLNRMTDGKFKQFFRMSRTSFFQLCKQVEDDPVFHNNSNRPQQPVIEQMMVTLHRLGTFGNGVSVGMVGHQFRIADGSVELYTNRCLMVILRLQSKLVTWPNARARSDISQDFKEVGFDGCVGLIDGSLVGLSTCPEKDGPDYYSRKGSYGIVTLLVCDKDKNITYLYTGWPGCSHDQRLMANCALTTSPTDYFSEGQYLLADSAFLPMENVVPAYRRQRHQPLTDEQNDFNRHLSGMRVAIENCIGLWKNRFQSLRGLRLRIANKQDMVRATAWIMACAVLHNYLNQGEDFEFEQEGSTADEAEVPLSATDNHPAGAASTAGTQKQLRVLMQAREFREDGGSY